ncbi:branched-chain amino acid ABC transporter permease [Microbacterium sp. NPDC077644]|uniref:branched-chain amino acid ABC transporter permease n=1 Tax=Microbacterium sp. NPDC077644 TaxID=3155055 RepID=UPI00344DCCBF
MLVTLIAGLAIGAAYTMVAVGYNLTWLTSKTVNFAYGAFIVAGMFLSVYLYNAGLPLIIVFAVLALSGSIVAIIEYLIAIRPLEGRGDHAELVTTVGVTTAIQGTILLLSPSEDAVRVPFLNNEGWNAMIPMPGGGRIAVAEIVLIAVSVTVALLAHFWATRTRSGLAALAQSEDRDAALVLGVRPKRMAFVGFMISGAIGFALAPFVGPVTFAVVEIAFMLALKGFVVLAIGGMGSQLGALLGGLGLGLVEALVIRFTGSSYQNLAVFIIFIATLLLRPQGLFGHARERVV